MRGVRSNTPRSTIRSKFILQQKYSHTLRNSWRRCVQPAALADFVRGTTPVAARVRWPRAPEHRETAGARALVSARTRLDRQPPHVEDRVSRPEGEALRREPAPRRGAGVAGRLARPLTRRVHRRVGRRALLQRVHVRPDEQLVRAAHQRDCGLAAAAAAPEELSGRRNAGRRARPPAPGSRPRQQVRRTRRNTRQASRYRELNKLI